MSRAETTPKELKALMESGEPPFVLDVREADEWGFCHIEGAEWIPLGELPARTQELPADRPIVCMCHHGGRSARAQQYLLQQGFKRVFNLTGGIHAWSRDVDPGIPTY